MKRQTILKMKTTQEKYLNRIQKNKQFFDKAHKFEETIGNLKKELRKLEVEQKEDQKKMKEQQEKFVLVCF